MLVVMGVTLEFGSACMGLVDVKMVPRLCGPIGMIVSTLLAMAFVVHGIVYSPPPDVFAWIAAVLVPIVVTRHQRGIFSYTYNVYIYIVCQRQRESERETERQ